MTITVITGTPGSGKTLYAIEKLLLPLVGTMIPVVDDNGVTTMHQRTIYTNINGLQIDHELIEHGGEWDYRNREWSQDDDANTQGAHNWHEWAQPGAIIVIDEFQKLWGPRPNGAAVPPDVQALDTHRHMGVDFILITQNVMNCDRHVHGLTNVHLHVRRIANLPAAVVYEWDQCSRQLQYSKALTKHPWRYNRRVYKLYRSAKVHTKQRRSLPGLVWFVLIGIVGAAVMWPTFLQRFQHLGKGEVARSGVPLADAHAGTVPAAKAASGAVATTAPASAAAAPGGPGRLLAEGVAQGSELAGCGLVRDDCRCFTAQGAPVKVEAKVCFDRLPRGGPVEVKSSRVSLPRELVEASRVSAPGPADLDTLAWLAQHRTRY